MAEHGGYRQPSHPAPVSGPGQLSARTDRGPKQHDITGGSYGSGVAFDQQQSAAPLRGQTGQPGGPAAPAQALVGLSAPSSMPEVPVTDGSQHGPGVGPEALGGPAQSPQSEEAQAIGKWLPTFIRIADSDGATPAFKRYVRDIIHNL